MQDSYLIPDFHTLGVLSLDSSSPGGVPDLVSNGANSRGLFDPPAPPRDPVDSLGEPPPKDSRGLTFAVPVPS